MTNLPKISIVTPSYNQGKFLEQTILSVINQNYSNLEYIIMDGGSTDNSVEIIKKYEKYLIYWISAKDGGQSDAIGKGFAKANGDILGWLNSDDVYMPGALQKIAEAYLKSPIASIYTGGLCRGDADGNISRCFIPAISPDYFLKYGIIYFWQPSSFFNSADYKKIGGINPALHFRMDGDLIYRLLKINPNIVKINNMVSFFRIHDASKSTIALIIHDRELNDFLAHRKVSMYKWKLLNWAFKLYKIFIAVHIKSFFTTMQYLGKNIATVWNESSKHIL